MLFRSYLAFFLEFEEDSVLLLVSLTKIGTARCI